MAFQKYILVNIDYISKTDREIKSLFKLIMPNTQK